MCGIAGWLDYYQNLTNKSDSVYAMCNTLVRRGPDAMGLYQHENICLMHRRLIVIDPEHGKQPMCLRNPRDEQHDYVMVYNGELYNTEDIRKELLALGYTFKGHSDTEVLLTAFAQWGEDCLQRLNGIYAFAIWDEKEQRLFMARDRMGVKPLFLYPYRGGILFGSEIKTLLANPMVKPQIDEDGLKEIFLIGPGRTCGNGVIKGVQELKPGEFAVFDETGLQVHTYWSVKAQEHTDNLQTTIEKTRFLICDAIKRQLVSDVPLCCFLSGGLDSSIISCIAAEQYRKTGKEPLTTYSVDYIDNQKYFTKSLFQPTPDKEYIQMMADFIGSRHKEVILSNNDLADALEQATEARDLPGMVDIDSSLLLFCKEVKKDFTVAVSGECADEIFGGYPWYHNKDILFEDCFPWSRSVELRKSIIKPGLLHNCDEYAYQKYKDTCNRTDKLPGDTPFEARMREMSMLNFYWFMQTLLDRKDRMSMYNGLEVRVPFCDHRIVEYAYNMPWEMKALNGREKGIVRQAVEDLLPEEIVWRKKSPYPKTHNPVYMQLITERVKNIMQDRGSPAAQLIDHNAVNEIIEHPDHISSPWYGQLMRAPQILAYILQLDYWMRTNKIELLI